MMRRRRLLSAAIASPALATACSQAQAAESLALALQQRVAARGVGLAAFELDAEAVRIAVAGHLRAGHADAVDADTLFEIGSITKTFTTLLLADAVQRRELALDTPVETLLPAGLKLRDSEDVAIQLRDLATHRSGLPRLPDNLKPAQPLDPYADYGADALHAFIESWRAHVPRDARYEYSNLGMGLLGHVLGRHHGAGFEARLTQRVLQPLKLDGMRCARPGTEAPAHSAHAHDGHGQPTRAWHFDALAGAGTLQASVRALARYAQAALGLVPHGLSPSFALCLQRHGDGPHSLNPTGLAWVLGTLNGRRIAAHDGGTFGSASALFLDLDQRRAAAVLSNSAGPVQDLALHALEPALAPRAASAMPR